MLPDMGHLHGVCWGPVLEAHLENRWPLPALCGSPIPGCRGPWHRHHQCTEVGGACFDDFHISPAFVSLVASPPALLEATLAQNKPRGRLARFEVSRNLTACRKDRRTIRKLTGEAKPSMETRKQEEKGKDHSKSIRVMLAHRIGCP